eukprot:9191339-Ditylum_brightwellii.AAC.1
MKVNQQAEILEMLLMNANSRATKMLIVLFCDLSSNNLPIANRPVQVKYRMQSAERRMNPHTYQQRNITSAVMRVFVVISIAFISAPSITTNSKSNSGNDNKSSEGKYSPGLVSSFQLNTVNTINTVKLRRTSNVGIGGLDRNSRRKIHSYGYGHGNSKQNQSLSLTLPHAGQMNYVCRGRHTSSKCKGLTTTTRLYNSSSNNADGSNNDKIIQNTITDGMKIDPETVIDDNQSETQPQSQPQSVPVSESSTSSTNQKEWNT